MDCNKPFEGSDGCNKGIKFDRRIPIDEELLNHGSVEVILKTWKQERWNKVYTVYENVQRIYYTLLVYRIWSTRS